MYELASTLARWGECLLLLPASARMRMPLEPVADAARRAAALFRQLGVVPLAAETLLTLARLESEREHYDQALSLLEQAEQWLAECGDAATDERAEALRREIERQYVAVSLSTCNEFRALEEANRLFRETADMDGLLAQIVKLAVEHSGGDRGFVAFSSGGGRLDVVAQHGLGRDRARRVLRVLEGVGGTRLAENGPLFSSRVTADPRFGGALTDALEGVGLAGLRAAQLPVAGRRPGVRRPAQRQPARRVQAARAEPARGAGEQRRGGDRRGAALAAAGREPAAARPAPAHARARTAW